MDSPDLQARNEPELQLPDFDVMVHCCQTLVNELPKLRNVPAFDSGAAIFAEMRAMRVEMNQMRVEMNQKFEGLDQKFEIRLMASNNNNAARLINGALLTADDQLCPFRNVNTNELIDQFPDTSRAIRSMQVPALDTVLRALGMETNGAIGQKKLRLRVQIGLRADPA